VATSRRTVVLALALAAGACSRGPKTGAAAAVTDEIGRPVTPRALPTRRVVSLAPNVTELLFAIGAGDQVVGIDRYSDQPAGRVERLPSVGSDYEPSLEKIVGLAPDLVLLSRSANRRETADALERLGVPSFITETPAVADMPRTLRDLGALTGHAADAARQLAALQGGLAAVRARVAGQRRPRVLVVVWPEPLYVAGRETFTHDLIEVAGGQNVAADARGYTTFPLERVLAAAPEIIILPTHAASGTGDAAAVAYWSRWPTLPAVRDHRVFAIEDAIISRPGARLVQGAERLAALLHPARGPAGSAP